MRCAPWCSPTPATPSAQAPTWPKEPARAARLRAWHVWLRCCARSSSWTNRWWRRWTATCGRAGGLGLFAACDITVAGLTSSFALTEARLGLSPAVISLTVLPRLTDRAASRYYLTGDRFDATEAERIGLVTITAENPDEVVGELAASFRRCSPQGLAASKQLTTHAMLATFDSDAERLIEMSATLFSSDDAQEGIASFMERRPPRWAE